MNWLGVKLDIKPVDHYMIYDVFDIGLQPRGFNKKNIMEMCYLINTELEDSELFQSAEVLDRAYSSVTLKEVASQQIPEQGRVDQSRECFGRVQHHL